MKNTLTTMMAGAATVAAVTASSTFMLGAATVTAVTVGSAFMAAPAEALSIGDVLDFQSDLGSSATLVNIGGDQFKFNAGDLVIRQNSAFGTLGTLFQSQDIILQEVVTGSTYTLLGPTPVAWLTGLDAGGDENRTFDLTSFTLNLQSPISTGGLIFSANFDGFFNPPGLPGVGIASGAGQLTSNVGSGISGNVEVVPTPAAVLPGLIGMGTAVFRKKKQEDEGEVTLETAGVRS